MICFPVTGRAADCDYSPQGWQVFLEDNWQSQYRRYQCSDNVWRLREQLLAKGCDLDGIKTVILRKLHPMHDPLVTNLARGDEPNETSNWSFHHVLVYDDLVVDLDYTNSPQVVTWAQYLETMFASTDGVWMQIKPLDDLTPRDLFGQFVLEVYPLFLITLSRQQN